MRHLAMVLGLAAALPAVAQSTAPQPIQVHTETIETIGFAGLVPINDGLGSKLPAAEFRSAVLDALAKAGHDAVGPTDTLPGSDRTSHPRFLLAGTVLVARCAYGYSSRHCQAQVRWEVFDRRSGQVVYRVRTRGETRDSVATGTRHRAYQVLLASLHSVMAREAFVDTLRRQPLSTESADSPRWPDVLHVRACLSAPAKLPDAMDDVLEAVLMVRGATGVGAAVVISADGFALTAAHVVGAHTEVGVASSTGTELVARVVRVEPEHDLALLALPGRGHPCRPLVSKPSALASPIFAVGATRGDLMAHSAASGTISAHRRLWGREFFQTDASLNPRNSGGPLFDASGSVEGIVSFNVGGPGYQGPGFGVPAGAVTEQLGLRLGDTSTRSLVGFSLRAPAPSVGVLIDWPDPDVDIPEHSPASNSNSYTAQREPDKDPMARMLRSAGITLIGIGVSVTLFGHVIARQPQGHRNAWIFGGAITGFGVVGLVAGLSLMRKTPRAGVSDVYVVPGPGTVHLLGRF